MTIANDKAKLRKIVLEKLQCQPQEVRLRKSAQIAEKIELFSEYKKAKAVMFYVARSEEVDTRALMDRSFREGQSVVVPWIDPRKKVLVPVEIYNPSIDLIPGTYGIFEPRPELAKKPFNRSRLNLILVPAVAFDRKGRRLGRGKGYYDRFLKTLPHQVKRFGLAFDFQVFESIPADEFDASVNQVITND